MKTIELTKGLVALVDDADFENLSKFKWHAVMKQKNGKVLYYATRSEHESCSIDGRAFIRKNTIYMHRQIMNPPGILRVDHADLNTLNNQRHNLRFATKAQNNMNARKPSHGLSSPYKGVTRFKRDGSFRAYIKKDGKQRHLGYFETQEAAALAYNEAAKGLFGEFALLNPVGI